MNVCNGKLKEQVNEDRVLLCGQVNDARSTAAVEVFHKAGYDVLTIDLEHTALNIETVADHIRVARSLGMPCMVRVASLNYDNVTRILDQGADGVFLPRVRSAEEVRRLIAMSHYPPEGERGIAGYGSPLAGYSGWQSLEAQIEAVNKNLVIGIQIETVQALENLDEILSVPGIDVAVIGCDDLSTSLGIPGRIKEDLFQREADRFIGICRKHGVMPGIPAPGPEAAKDWIDRGMRMIWYGVDIGLMWKAASDRVQGLRSKLAGTVQEKQ